MRNLSWPGGILAGLTLAFQAQAQAVTDPTKPPPPPAQPASATTTPSPAPPSPFTFTAAYTADLLADVSGGVDRGADYVDLMKLSAAYDGANLGHAGLTGLVSLEHAFGSGFTARRVGGLQSVSASEAQPGSTRLYELWLQQALFEGQGGVKVGLIDINTTFDVQETGALFFNASHGIGPDLGDTGLNGPSDYPTPTLGATAFYRPSEDWTAQLGIFDGVAGDPAHRADFVAVKLEGALVIGQIDKRFGDRARLEIGAWTYTAAFPELGGPTGASRRMLRDDSGVYGLVEGRLLPKPSDNDGGLSGWVRIGLANGEINEVSNYLGGGLVYTGLIEGREKDEIGLAIARAGLGAGARRTGSIEGRATGAAETDLEATYRYVLKDWLNIQPDLQYVIHPRGDQHISNAVVVGLRFAFTYSK